MPREIPDFLRKHGITRVTDNVQPGQQVRPPAGLLFTLFREELMDALTTGGRHATAADDPATEQ